jgi:mRNA-degrading endonuclease YafQ of YafQ-DinJ toxin-antitoxin module
MSHKNVVDMVKGAEAIDVTGKAMLRMVDNKANLMTYSELEKHNSIDDVLGKDRAVILLYQSHRFDGHWTCLFESHTNPNKLIFWDSYGIPMDEELKFSEFNTRRHQGQITPHLTALIDKSNYTVESNKHQFQKDGNRDSECGSHTALRLVFREMSNKKYQTFMTTNSHFDSDFWAVALTLLFR